MRNNKFSFFCCCFKKICSLFLLVVFCFYFLSQSSWMSNSSISMIQDINNQQNIKKPTLSCRNTEITMNRLNYSVEQKCGDNKVIVKLINDYAITRNYPANKWSDEEQQKTLQKIEVKWQKTWLFSILLGLQWVVVRTTYNEKENVDFYYVDKLAIALKEQIQKQKKSLLDPTFDFTKIQGEARKQLLIPYKKNGFLLGNYSEFFKESSLYNRYELRKIMNDSSFTYYKDRIEALGFSTIQFWSKPIAFDKMIYATGSVSLVNFQLKKKINDVASSYLHTLQKAADFSLSHITVNKETGEKVDVSSLVNSKTQEASDLFPVQLKIIKKLRLLGLKKLQTQVQTWIDSQIQIISAFQKNWDAGEVSSYLLWLPMFDIQEVKLSQNKVVPVSILATTIQTMLNEEKLDFTTLQGEARKQLLNLLDAQGKLREVKTFQDDVWRQIKNHQNWKTVEGPLGQLVLESIRTLLLKVQDLGITKVYHSSFLEGYDLSFLWDNPNWKKIAFKNLLLGMTVKVNGTNVEFASHLFPNQVVFQVPIKKLDAVFSEITIIGIVKTLERAISIQVKLNTKKILAFQKSWDAGKVSSYFLWLPVFDIKEVKLSQGEMLPVDALAAVIETMLTAEKFDFTKLKGQARKQLLNLLDAQGKLREAKTFQDDVWKQIKNHQNWKTVEGPLGQLVLESIKTLLLEIQDLGITQVSHPFFPKGYDLNFLQDNEGWKKISFKKLLQGMKVKVKGTYIEFYSHLFPNKVVFQVSLKNLTTVFSLITIAKIKTSFQEAINAKLDAYKTDIQSSLIAYAEVKVQQFKIKDQVYHIDHLIKLINLHLSGSQLPQDAKNQLKILLKAPISRQQLDEALIKILVSKQQKLKSVSDVNLIIGLSVGGSVLALSILGGFLYWFYKIKK